ncbi:serine/threonine protein kinase [Nocardia asteroides NBRC 15531]|uniref:non-specific serine/threonine protein kinase n=1 Tax=Nocardia asteroides NBRC 15531 TaxID=1110697 RepID=U5EBE7_NOCAS|nr:serine/threonine-protein kinase [Nocardia asteroides]TLF69718.1 serine/threonine protein kinase [Nocardia asteroides NBRC 15531]UGT49220.1 serine/threonine protein kinase [Nocardia asteroides]GAD83798.1 putative serine/threonine protein kinase [Nocardia asteroides NBRC 15531]
MAGGAMAGSMFGRYELRRLLGVGGMGEVYEAYDTSKNRTVAVKVLNRELARDPVYVQRFRRESQAMASVQEPHVIPVHDWGEVDGVLYIDMRLVKGTDLKERLQRHGRLTPGEAVQVVEQIAAALDAAHEIGLVHRDVKPANILITGSMFAYLVDFGVAHADSDPHLTSTGSAVGSMAYMAPERFEDAPLTAAVDTYALTCVLYECLVGRVPYPVNSLAGAIGSHQMAPPPRPSAVDPALEFFDAVVDRGMAKRPGQRYATPGDLARAARTALVQTERAAPRTAPGPQLSVATVIGQVPRTPDPGQPPPPTVSGPQVVVPASAPPPWTPPPGYRTPTGPQPTRVGGYTHPSAPLPLPQQPPRRSASTPILVGALGALIVLAAVGGAVWVMLDRGGDQAAEPPKATGEILVPPPPAIETVSQTVPTTTRTVPTPSKTTVPPLQSSVAGADGQGFLSGGARCNDNDAAMTIARTTGSRVVICHTGDNRYYYKGARASDGLGIELDDPVPTGGGGFTATNPTDGTQYQLTPAGLTISKGGSVLASEQVTEFAHR